MPGARWSAISRACAKSTRRCPTAAGCSSSTSCTSRRSIRRSLSDWGTSYVCAQALGDRAFSLVDLGHHGPSTNVEQIVARLIQLGKLGGFHFNDSKYGDDDLDAGSIKPFQLFLIFNELVDAEREGVKGFDPAYMLDQSHAVTDPIESLATSAIELVRAHIQAHLVDRDALACYQERNDALMALQTLKQAFHLRRVADSRDGAAARGWGDRSRWRVSRLGTPATKAAERPGRRDAVQLRSRGDGRRPPAGGHRVAHLVRRQARPRLKFDRLQGGGRR